MPVLPLHSSARALSANIQPRAMHSNDLQDNVVGHILIARTVEQTVSHADRFRWIRRHIHRHGSKGSFAAGPVQDHTDHFLFTDLLNSLRDGMLGRHLGTDNEYDLSHKIRQYSRFGRQ